MADFKERREISLTRNPEKKELPWKSTREFFDPNPQIVTKQLLACKIRITFFKKSGHTFLLILSTAGKCMQIGLMRQAIAQ